MADYIATIPQEKFDMTWFREDEYKYTHECNSVGCVIGHCTVLDDWDNIPKEKNGEIDFVEWAEEFTGLDAISSFGFTEWLWCFSGSWAGIDNTPIGASKRIMWLIEHGLPEDGFEQMVGKNKLCYI